MILYFTGTGNSRYIAERIAAAISDEVININEKIKNGDTTAISVQDRLIFVAPTYAWRMPEIMTAWVRKTQFPGAEHVWFVMDCGSEIGNAAKYNQALCEEKGFSYMGTAQIVMPENYIAMFGAPEMEEAKKIIAKADPVIDQAAEQIAGMRNFQPPRCNLYDRFMSGPVNKIFYALFVKADAFRVSEKCVGCGKCEKLCPLNNVKLVDGKPVWGKECTHCMACIAHCPAEAIEYGKKSVGKPRYHL